MAGAVVASVAGRGDAVKGRKRLNALTVFMLIVNCKLELELYQCMAQHWKIGRDYKKMSKGNLD